MPSAKKILLIEDEPEFRQALRLRLEANGYEVVEAEDGVMGLDMARNIRPDLIILDVMLPKMDGFKVARLLKFDTQYQDIPVLMLTVMSQASNIKMGKTVGADAYMTKPYQPQELLDTVLSLVSKKLAP